jgi:hypothetical protein
LNFLRNKFENLPKTIVWDAHEARPARAIQSGADEENMNQMNGINSSATRTAAMQNSRAAAAEDSGSGFGELMGDIADGALAGLAAVAPILPGGEIIKMAANGLRGLSSDAPAGLGGLGGARGEKLEQMWQMQQDNQIFNLQYLHLQQSLQADNRHFSTMSNLLKARHDTAKTAINNMRV